MLSPELELAGDQDGVIHTQGQGMKYTHTHTHTLWRRMAERVGARLLRKMAQSLLEE